ncbi:exodeoxyribonuclease-3 [Methanobrevibacter olleyae]|uniref:Exodeoxyribonuclease-3 n=1 Tax=Methanobrevibacter olleyae TaxID=294671 RepID=A0A1I4K5R5_METOL|nr:exodeoxyribonuclease III [Methanobrevibacter olleyae]SFL74090.1 exodeoxyribonuclease-3 [Methanobrevibacter olleyae]
MTNIRFISWNVNGIRAIHRKGFLDWFNEEKADIVCLQETKAQANQLPKKLVNIPDYTSYFNSAERKGYSGVATYTSYEPKDVYSGMGIEKFDIEGRLQRLDFDDFTLLNIYYPNGGMGEERLKYKLDFYDAFLDYVNDLRDKGHNLVICGDLNTAHKEIDLARPKANEDVSGFLAVEREWVSKFLDNGYIDTFRMFHENEKDQYTWWSYRTRARERNVGWRLDYFFVNEEFKDNVKASYIKSNVMGSDHCPIALEIEI